MSFGNLPSTGRGVVDFRTVFTFCEGTLYCIYFLHAKVRCGFDRCALEACVARSRGGLGLLERYVFAGYRVVAL